MVEYKHKLGDELMKELSNLLKVLSKGDTNTILIFLSIMSCFFPAFAYFYVEKKALFISLDTIKLILLVLSTGTLTFSAFFLIEFLAYGIRLSKKCIDSNVVDTILLMPLFYNTALFSCLIFMHADSLVKCLLTVIGINIYNIVFHFIQGVKVWKKDKKKQKEELEYILALLYKIVCDKDTFYEFSIEEEKKVCFQYSSKKELDKVIEGLVILRNKLPEE